MQETSSSIASKPIKNFNRIAINVLMDVVLAAIAAPLSRWLADPQGGWLHPLWFLTGGVLTLLVSGLPFHVPQQYWRFSGVSDLLNIAGAAIGSAFLFTIGLWLTGYPIPSLAFPIIYALVLLVLMGGGRILYRLASAENRRIVSGVKQRVLLIGSDEDADLFLRAIKQNRSHFLQVIGLISQYSNRKGHRIHNFPILGSVEDLESILIELEKQQKLPSELVITGTEFRGGQLRKVIAIAESWKISVKRTPSLTSLTPASVVELHPIALEELLNRPQIPLDREGMDQMIRNKVVLVTGAGGTIGSELVRQIVNLSPKLLILLDQSEYALWKINFELSEQKVVCAFQAVLANIRDNLRIRSIFQLYKPELVFHAAALKHVPMMEANPIEGFLTNIIGSRIVANAAAENGAQAFVMISTDKAVNPSSMMGASKRVAEMYCQALDIVAHNAYQKDQLSEGILPSNQTMRCITVRFGNVLGSTGSVVPLFRRQLKHGGPLTVTHPDMTRYFMTVPEAVGLVLQACVRATIRIGAEEGTDQLLRKGGIFVLNMGEPVKILDLARQLIRLAGLKPGEDVPIQFTGLRPGEKLFEELFHGREAPIPTDHEGLMIATPRTVNLGEVNNLIDQIEDACLHEDVSVALVILKNLVPEFVHQSNS